MAAAGGVTSPPVLQKDTPSRNLFIAGFKAGMNDDALRELFQPFGSIESAKVMLDIHTGASRGFAFVLYVRLEDAVRARSSMNGRLVSLGNDALAESAPPSPVDQFRLTVDFAKHDAFNVVTRSTKVYCRNIPSTMAEADIINAIESVVGRGTIVTIAVLPDSTRSPALFDRRRGPQPALNPQGERSSGNVAFIEFATLDIAQLAVDRTYRMRFDGPGSQGPLMTKYAETAEVRSERKKRRHVDPAPSPQPAGAFPARPVFYVQPTAISTAPSQQNAQMPVNFGAVSPGYYPASSLYPHANIANIMTSAPMGPLPPSAPMYPSPPSAPMYLPMNMSPWSGGPPSQFFYGIPAAMAAHDSPASALRSYLQHQAVVAPYEVPAFTGSGQRSESPVPVPMPVRFDDGGRE